MNCTVRNRTRDKQWKEYAPLFETIMQATLESVRKDPYRGDSYYAVLYETYFSQHKHPNHSAVLIALQKHGIFMSAPSYYKYLRWSIEAFSKILWTYMLQDCMDIVQFFLPKWAIFIYSERIVDVNWQSIFIMLVC